MTTRTVTLMSSKHPVSFMVNDEVTEKLLKNATEYAKKTGEASSKYVNSILEWALANYKPKQD